MSVITARKETKAHVKKALTSGPYALAVPTEHGDFLAHYSGSGLCALDFPERRSVRASRSFPDAVAVWHELTAKALARALKGEASGPLPPLDLSGGTPFRQRVWQALLRIQLGETQSYADVAAAIDQPKATRAVGNACGANPIPVFVPCHRVLAAQGRLGGFSGGLDWKLRLLEREGSWPRKQPELPLAG